MVSPAPPTAQISVEKCEDPQKLHADIKAACRQLLEGWGALREEQVEISFIAGGISNALYKVAPEPATGLAPVAFRIYGDNTENFIDRGEELERMLALHSAGFGPKLLGVFETGRIEEFLPMRCLAPEEMASPSFAPAIARTLRRFHDAPLEGKGEASDPRTPFGRILEWLDTAQQFVFDDPQKQRLFEAFDFGAMRREVAAVQAACARAKSPVVFAHNDLLSGNIMISLDAADAARQQEDGAAATAACGGNGGSGQSGGSSSSSSSSMTFIDFEYAEWAPRGHDIGNHFCEYAGFECDYSRYPGQAAAELFLRHYLAAGQEGGSPDSVDPAELARCVAEANVYALAAHMYWGTWSFLQAKWSSIDFDYLAYAQLRWGEYYRRRDEFLAAAEAAFPA